MKKPVLNMIDTPIHSKSKKKLSFKILSASNRQKSKNFTYVFARKKKKRNDIHTDMQYIIKNVI